MKDKKSYQKPVLNTRVVELGVFGQYGDDDPRGQHKTSTDPIKVLRGGNMRPT